MNFGGGGGFSANEEVISENSVKANFAESPKGEVRRNPIPGSSVNNARLSAK
jgi:hypothetical protein